MSLLRRTLRSSIGRKQIVAITGLGLVLFLVGHLAGNLLLLIGHEAFDEYAQMLEKNPLLIPAEIILLSMFLVHVGLALKTNLENRSARSQAYIVSGSTGKKNFFNSTMVATGIITLIFLILHLIHFKFGERPVGRFPDGTVLEGSLYVAVVLYFKESFLAVVWYVVAVTVLSFHVTHGFQSAFQTLGIHHNRYTPMIRWTSIGLGAIIAIGYSILPLYCKFGVELERVVQEASK